MKLISQTLLSCMCLSAFASFALAQQTEALTAEQVEYFEKQIRPLLVKRCYSCHSEQEASREGGLVLDSRDGWSTGGENGPAIIPGDPDASRLIRAVRYADSDLQMPPDKRLTDESVAKLEKWVRMGAPDPRTAKQTEQPERVNPSDPIAGKSHWAFQPLTAQSPPVVTDSQWPRTDIDRFILAKLESEHMKPVADADRRTLARRVYLQLIGLPPTPEQMQRFLADDRDDAYERLVDELLNSPHFGERWGRHWLDLARYADSNGLDENFLFREAWRYRNWVISAVNEDLPFDRFLLEQIAGDLLPYESIEQRDQQRIAAGFLVVGPKVLLGNDPKRQRMEVADEQIDTIGKAILGQTLGCARCHNHKFDPIPTADYYAMAGIFTSTDVMEQRFMLNQQRVMERLVGLGPDGEALDDKYEHYWRVRPELKEKLDQANAALKLLQDAKSQDFENHAVQHPISIAEQAADVRVSREERIEAQKKLIAEIKNLYTSTVEIPPRAMIPSDVEEPGDEHIRLAGEFDRLGDEVRGFLQVLSDDSMEIPEGKSGRLELARWLTDTETGAGELAARVLANRIWYHLMGRGIVRTVDNFGRTGEVPSHPELLDDLANELIRSNWSVKSLVREIALSRTFTLSSAHNESAYEADPENRLFWRAHRRRLDPEQFRDAMMLAAGTLDAAPMDSTVWYLGDQATAVGANKNRRRTDFSCRSVYLPVIRNDLPELFDVFDFANPHATTGMRPQTMMATQGLFALNDVSVMEAATATTRKLMAETSANHPQDIVRRMYERVLNAQPTDQEQDTLINFVEKIRASFSEEDDEAAELRAWSIACHSLFASSRFQIVE